MLLVVLLCPSDCIVKSLTTPVLRKNYDAPVLPENSNLLKFLTSSLGGVAGNFISQRGRLRRRRARIRGPALRGEAAFLEP